MEDTIFVSHTENVAFFHRISPQLAIVVFVSARSTLCTVGRVSIVAFAFVLCFALMFDVPIVAYFRIFRSHTVTTYLMLDKKWNLMNARMHPR